MKFNAIRDFLAVAERGSLRAAARQIGGSQPARSWSANWVWCCLNAPALACS